MLKGVNDLVAEARALVKLLKDIPSKINLIHFNSWPSPLWMFWLEHQWKIQCHFRRNWLCFPYP